MAFETTLKSLASLLIISFSIGHASAQLPNYHDVASDVGIQHTYLLNNAGGGVSFVDFDQDGLDDITLATGLDEGIHFYRNTGNGFDKIDLGISNTENTKTVLWADIDNDGDKDFYVTAFTGPNHLYENKGDLIFEEITEDAGLPIDSLKSFGAIWGDYNRDGFLDLYYTERPNANSGTTQRNRLFKNLGGTTFEEVTTATNAGDEGRLPFCAAFFDYNNDKWPDVYIANDRKKRNTLLRNDEGVFTDVSDECNAGIEIDAMNVGIADIDNDGLDDIYVTNTPSGSALLKCTFDEDSEDITYTDEAEERGIGFFGIGWGANFFDADNDGWQDLYVSGMLIGSDVISSAMYMNDGTGYFDELTTGFDGDTVTSFVNAIGDFDDDGFPDIMVSNSEYYDSQLWTSESGDYNWLKITLQGVRSNRDGIGARMDIYSGDLVQKRFTHCGIAFMGQNTNNHMIGLGERSVVDSIKITWPTGHVDLLSNINANQRIHIIEGQSTGGTIHIDDDIVLLTNTTNQEIRDIKLSPNPASNRLYIDGLTSTGNTKYNIYSSFGQLIYSDRPEGNQIDIARLSSGMYFLQIIEDKKTITTLKFIKK